MKLGKLKVFVKPLKRIRNASIALVSGTYILSGAMYGFGNVNKTLERDYYEIVYETDDLFDAVSNGDLEHIDYDALSSVKNIRIDMVNSNSFSNLKYFINLERIEICNSQLLTDSDIELLNSLPLGEISLYFDRNYVLKNIDNKFDLGRFKDKKTINYIEFNNSVSSDEIDSIIFFEYLTNYNNCNVDFIKYEPLNDSLNNVIKELNISDKKNDLTNLTKIVNYVSKHIHYDTDILNYTKDHSFIWPFFHEYWDLKEYNEKTLSKVVSNNPESDKSAICINYADLTLALCIKANIKSNAVSGIYKDTQHSWNIVTINDYDTTSNNYTVGTYYLDTTWFDTNIQLKHQVDNYLNTLSTNELNNLKDSLLIARDGVTGLEYKIDNDYIDYFNGEEVKSDINNIYGTRVNQIRVFLFNALYSLVAYEGITGLYMLIQYLKKRSQIKDLKPEKVKEKKEKIKLIRKIFPRKNTPVEEKEATV